MIEIVAALSEKEVIAAGELFREYAASLPFALDFQDFEDELRRLPGNYAPPGGRILLALCDGEKAGCAALRPLGERVCEMKRLYLRPRFRGRGIGKQLTAAIIRCAREAGYQAMRLDTVASMTEAIALYEAFGFREIEPYRFNPLPDARYFELQL